LKKGQINHLKLKVMIIYGNVLYAFICILTASQIKYQGVQDVKLFTKKAKNCKIIKNGGKMITEIGIVAGEIWSYLEKYNETTFEKLIKATGRDRDLLIMGLGWLAREGHIILEKVGNDYKIKLHDKR